jgi:hypothetical protein
MPLTQRIWTWDHFLHGGHDFESVAFLLLVFFSLVLVLSKHSKQYIARLFASWSFHGCKYLPRPSSGIPLRRNLPAFRFDAVPCPPVTPDSVSLQI